MFNCRLNDRSSKPIIIGIRVVSSAKRCLQLLITSIGEWHERFYFTHERECARSSEAFTW